VDGLLSPRSDNNGVAYGPLDDTTASLGWGPPSLVDLADRFADDRAAEADRADIAAARRALAVEVRGLFVRALSLRSERALGLRALDAAGRIEASAHARVQAEAAPVLDERLAGLERLEAAADLADLEAELARVEGRLQSLTGADAEPALLESPSRCQPGESPAAALARAIERSPRLRGLSARLQGARAEAGAAWVGWVPWIDRVQLGYANEPTTKRDALRARIDFALPLFSPLSARAQEAALDVARLEALYADEERAVAADVRAAHERMAGAERLVSLYQAASAGVIDASVTVVESELSAGQTDVLRVAEVQAKAIAAQRGLLRAKLRREEAAIDLLRLTDDVVPAQR
jgi:outer membrane protein TolC